MQNTQATNFQTPIEITLEVDKDGMTTTRKLYAFLELEPKNYSRWCKTNIVENEFAEANVDFWAFVINEEWGGQASKDYKLTAHFAKKLSVKGNSARAEEAREYFTRIEEKAKQQVIDRTQLSPSLQRNPGITKTELNSINKLTVICGDKSLRPVYETVVKEMMIAGNERISCDTYPPC